jgi:hypothetical protein
MELSSRQSTRKRATVNRSPMHVVYTAAITISG